MLYCDLVPFNFPVWKCKFSLVKGTDGNATISPALCAASGPLWPCHQESPDPRPADSQSGHEGSDRCLHPGERLGGGLLRGPSTPIYTLICQHLVWTTHKYMRTDDLLSWRWTVKKWEKPHYRLLSGSHTSFSTFSSPVTIFAAKLPASNSQGSTFKSLLLPLNAPPFFPHHLIFFSYCLFFHAWPFIITGPCF